MKPAKKLPDRVASENVRAVQAAGGGAGAGAGAGLLALAASFLRFR